MYRNICILLGVGIFAALCTMVACTVSVSGTGSRTSDDSQQGDQDATGQDDGTSSPSEPEELGPVATVQQTMPVTEFEGLVAGDSGLAAVVDMARTAEGAGDFILAGEVADGAGVELVLGVLSTAGDDEAVVVRHCQAGDCISALQTEASTEEEIEWTGPDGPVAVRTVRVPYQLRLIDETDPDGTAVIAPVDLDLTSLRARGVARRETDVRPLISSIVPVGGKDVSRRLAPVEQRKLRVVSAFGGAWVNEIEFDDLVGDVRDAGFPDGDTIHHVNQSELDTQFSTLGPGDALVIYSHGDESESQGRVVGMTVARYYWLPAHYSEQRMLNRMSLNPNGGPGIVFFAGCKTGDMLPTFDTPSRIALGFSKGVHPGQAAKAMKLFFKHFSGETTLGQAIDAVNAEFAAQGFKLLVNSKANRDIKLEQVGDFDRPGCRDTCDFARDGVCDDGGPGSAHASCDLGTDCYDCGARDVDDEEPDSDQVVSFSDRCLEDAVRRAISKDTGDIAVSDLGGLTSLTASRVGIANLSGLEHCTNLEYLDLVDNDIVDLGPLAGLPKLKTLHLGNNLIANISPLANLPALEVLTLIANQVSDLGALQGLTTLVSLNVSYQLDMPIPEGVEAQQPPGFVYGDHTILSDVSRLGSLTGLTELRLSGNQISDISSLASLTELRTLGLAHNQITGLGPLQGLPNLGSVFLNQNPVTDLGPLAGNSSLGEGTTLYLNCCSPDFDCDGLSTNAAQCGYVSDLEARGVSVNAGYDSKLDEDGNRVPDEESCAVMPPILGLGSGTCDVQ